MVQRKLVLLLLCVTVLAPIVLYTDRLASFSGSIANSGFGDDFSNLNFGSEVGKLHSVHQESLAVKEPVGVVYVDNSSNSDQISAHTRGGSVTFLDKELPFGSSGEHKNRVLSAADEGDMKDNQNENQKLIEQVISRENSSYASQQSQSKEENKDLGPQQITDTIHSEKLNHDRQLWKLGSLPPGLITFWKRTFPLDHSWHVLGLGYNPNVNQKEIEHAAVIHYNGNMKPWLEIGIPKYRGYWSKYVDYDQGYLRDCNINP